MKSYHLTFLSKNKNSLSRNFLLFTSNSSLNFHVVKKYFQKKTEKHFLTILKSPHVNKSAQEQFEFHLFSKQLSIFPFKRSHYTYILKKVRNTLFSDVMLKIKSSINKEKKNNTRLVIFNPNNFKLNINKSLITQKKRLDELKNIKQLKNFDEKNNKKVKLMLQTFDIYGEFCKIV